MVECKWYPHRVSNRGMKSYDIEIGADILNITYSPKYVPEHHSGEAYVLSSNDFEFKNIVGYYPEDSSMVVKGDLSIFTKLENILKSSEDLSIEAHILGAMDIMLERIKNEEYIREE